MALQQQQQDEETVAAAAAAVEEWLLLKVWKMMMIVGTLEKIPSRMYRPYHYDNTLTLLRCPTSGPSPLPLLQLSHCHNQGSLCGHVPVAVADGISSSLPLPCVFVCLFVCI